MSQVAVVKVKCEECGRVLVKEVVPGNIEGHDYDLIAAQEGEHVLRFCGDCGQVREHEVLAE